MIGHARRARESAERRRRWWAGLTDDEREFVTFREQVHEPRAVFYVVVGFACFVAFIWLLVLLGT